MGKMFKSFLEVCGKLIYSVKTDIFILLDAAQQI
jgi:hypothetical protein